MPSEESTAHLRQTLLDLQTISSYHHFAAHCISILHSLAERWGVELPKEAAAYASSVADDIPGSLPMHVWSSWPQVSGYESESVPLNFSHQDFAFLPPPLLEQPPPLPADSSSSSVVADDRYSQAALWTPFPWQSMPASRRRLAPPVPTQSSSGGEPDTSWTLADRSASSLSAQSPANPQQRRSSGYKRP